MLVGTPSNRYAPVSRASAQVFVRTDGSWAQEAVFVGIKGFGTSVALNGDGSRALVSAPPRVYQRNGATWVEEATLSDDSWGTFDATTAVALSTDGSRAMVAGPGDNPATVVARVYVQSGAAWNEETLSVSEPAMDSFGPSLAMDGTGERVIVASRGNGLARVFVRANGAWSEEAILTSANVTAGGHRVAISADGAHALVEVAASEYVIPFARTGDTWTEKTATYIPRNRGLEDSGALAMSADGSRALLGLSWDSPAATTINTSGSVRVLALEGGALRQRFVLVADVGANVSRFGAAAAMNADGTRLAVGSPTFWNETEFQLGRAYVYTIP
jgi:hypothetical protein